MDSSLTGESAAVLVSCFWTGSSLLFTFAGKKIGAFGVNAYRTTMATALLFCTHVVFLGVLLPAASSAQWFWMGLSGVVGLGVGDFGLFAAYIMIGPRRSVLIQASSPIFAALGAYVMLPQSAALSPMTILGIAITLTGIVVVLLEREKATEERHGARKLWRWGVLFGVISAMGQGFGVVLSKRGMSLVAGETMNPISAALIRMLLAGVFIWTCVLLAGKFPAVKKAAKDREGIKYTAAGAVIGPFLGMTLSMVAIAGAQAGVAQTLMSLMPIFIIPVVWVAYREKTNWRGILGAAIAVAGVAILFLP